MAERPTKYADTAASISLALRDAKELARKIDRGPSGREVSLVITKLQEAHMWLNEAFTLRDNDD